MNNKVLIIEDERELSELLKRFLIKKQYEVTCVENLNQAMHALHMYLFDTIILDNNLPDGKGIDIIPTIHASQNKPTIIAMSALHIRDEVLNAGASYYIEKPISTAAIYQLMLR
ncbi:MAG: response regulator transcription factor [Saprospiraceae bacterium]|nr:response regulator transcription factor [Saprospiraceae bacterium]